MNATLRQNYTPELSTSMKGPFIASGVFHALIFILSIIGLPYLAKDAPVIITPVSIELVDISELTRTTHVAPPKKQDKPPEIEKPEPPKVEPAPPKVISEAPPNLTKPEPPEKLEQPEPIEPPEPEPIQEVVKKEAKPQPKPKAKPKKPPPKPKTKEQNDFDSLLKNLAIEEDKSPAEKTIDDIAKEAASGQIAPLGETLTISELDAIRQQLEPCWNIPIGAKYAENLVVKIRATMNRDMTVRDIKILDTGRYSRDNAFKAAADSAARSLRNPRCVPLKLPADKYDQWQTITINFDPSSVL